MYDLDFDGMFYLSEKGIKKREMICEIMKDNFIIVNDSEADRITVFNENAFDYEEIKELADRMSENGYIKEGCIDIKDRAFGGYWRLKYVPEKNEWCEFQGKLPFADDVQEALKTLTPEQQKAVMAALWN